MKKNKLFKLLKLWTTSYIKKNCKSFCLLCKYRYRCLQEFVD